MKKTAFQWFLILLCLLLALPTAEAETPVLSDYDAEFLRVLPGEWAEEDEGMGIRLTMEENGEMALFCYGVDGSFAYTWKGAWSYEPVPEISSQLTLHFTSTDHPLHPEAHAPE